MTTKAEPDSDQTYDGAYGVALAEILALHGYLERTFGDLPPEQREAAVKELQAFARAMQAILACRE